jgi:ATP-binding cassette subfamily C protein EexD
LKDLAGLRQFMAGNGLFAFFDAPWLPIYIAVLFMFHPWYGWASIACAVFLLLLACVNEKLTGTLLARANKENIGVSLNTTKNLRNAEAIESMGMLDSLVTRWSLRYKHVLLLQSEASDRSGIITSVSKTSRQLMQSLILGLGAYLAVSHEISPGLVIAGSVLLGRALAPLDLLTSTWKGFISARSQYARLNAILDKQRAEPERMELPSPAGNIAVENLVVGAPGSRVPVIKSISFVAAAGTIVGIVGPSASGKSTLAKALMGIWRPQQGVVRLDGADIAQWDKRQLGQHLGYLPQDIELFEGTISDNIARFGVVDAGKVVLAARTAGVHEMILLLPHGYDTMLGDGGGNLSAGQRQRIGLARALYDSPRLIVLDEPNSNLDEAGERALASSLQQAKATGALIFVIAHRASILSQLDSLLVMNAGTIGLYGPREQVLMSLAAQRKAAVRVETNTTSVSD